MARGYVLHMGVVRMWKSSCWRLMFDAQESNDTLHRLIGAVHTVQTRLFSSSSRRKPPPPNLFLKLSRDHISGFPYTITEEQENLITHGDSEGKIKLQRLLLSLALKQERGVILPEEMSVKQFHELVDCNESEVDEMLNIYHSRCEIRKASSFFKKIEADKKPRKDHSNVTNKSSFLDYQYYKNSLIIPPTNTSQSRFYNANLAKGLLFGQKVIFDCSYDSYMSFLLLRETAKHLNQCIGLNQRSRRPFALNFCNVESKSPLMHHLSRENPAIDCDLPVNVHKCSYLDLFRREDIVYLTPYVNQELEYHPDDVFVLGALGHIKDRLSIKKGRLEGVRCAKIPLGFKQILKQNPVLSVYEAFETLLAKKNAGDRSHARQLGRSFRVDSSNLSKRT